MKFLIELLGEFSGILKAAAIAVSKGFLIIILFAFLMYFLGK